MLSTIGYERAELADFIATLKLSKIDVLVDIRDRAQSRRPGFSKTALSAALAVAGIEYRHVPALGDPKAGREAARRRDYDAFRAIFGSVMKSEAARLALLDLVGLAQSKSICLMCFERDQLQCHRKIVSDYLAEVLNVKAQHLGVRLGVRQQASAGRVCNNHQGAAAQI